MTDFLCGVIEGFYGRTWPWPVRRSMIEFLHQQQFNAYVYAPKADRKLRSDWRHLHSAAEFEALLDLRAHCNAHSIQFGIGLSPSGLQVTYGADDRAALEKKIAHLNRLDSDVLCILFDDMPGAIADLAERQVSIVKDIMAMSSARRFVICPSYYSFDPVLEQLFGAMPERYLETLGELLPKEVDIFWTGSLVLSPGYSVDDIDAITMRIGRKPMLWDNYPVNDGKRISRFLHLKPVRNRPPQLQQLCSGFLANPMNQPLLSQLPLASLARNFYDEQYDADCFWRNDLERFVDADLAALLRRDVERFQEQGLDTISELERETLIEEYRGIAHPAAAEVIDWLQEGYRFDPACLTS
ncbi:MAG: beta-N-acetylglucosaminidase domain-containing protein [Spongiibacteraceae bacterium]